MKIFAYLLLLVSSLSLQAQMEPLVAKADATQAFTAAEQARYLRFTNELRCLVCQNQTIAESQAPLAVDLRQKVAEQIAAGQSDAQITRWLTDRYGDYVLYRPPFKASTWLLWAGPFLLLVLALGLAWRLLRKPQAAARPAPVADPDALQKLLDEYPRNHAAPKS